MTFTTSAGSGSTDSGGDSADRVITLPKAIPRPTLPSASEEDRKRGLKIIKQVTKRLAEVEFLSERPPELLAADLKVAAVLFRAGLAEAWISEQEFFDATLAIWLPLFFNAEGEESTGWLEQRYLTAPKQQEFAEAIRSVELAAALGCWALSTPAKGNSPEHARFDLASALGVARLPWLWQMGGNERVAKEIAEVFALTSRSDDIDGKVIERRWLTLIRRGYALGLMERAAVEVGLAVLRSRIAQTNITAGELLWQGTAGFCVTTSNCVRRSGTTDTVEVLALQQGKAKKFRVGFLVPVMGLLEDGVLGDSVMPVRVRESLQPWSTSYVSGSLSGSVCAPIRDRTCHLVVDDDTKLHGGITAGWGCPSRGVACACCARYATSWSPASSSSCSWTDVVAVEDGAAQVEGGGAPAIR